ncbi:hypothetical protein ANO11243_079360 [Dothideomycetidae sp. 11243]|nr:hypothetical protein ANO11243_079360 [fungal sp. No.11243]
MPRQTGDTPATSSAKRKRSPTDGNHASVQDGISTPGSNTPVPVGKAPLRKRIRESEVRPSKRARSPLTSSQRPAQREPSPPRSPPAAAPRKRPGAGARIDAAARQAVEDRRRQREEEDRRQIAARNSNDLVATHYNMVPQRGRDWRKTDSSIRGLRSFNNWVKSALIQKFSRPDIPVQNLLVLDIGCGKGGDLQKWQSAPQVPALYVGIDPASTSVDQARGRYQEMQRRQRGPRRRPLFDAHFFAQDCFGQSIGNLPIIQQVGFDPHAGPSANGNIMGRMARGGFDVVSMMFCLHYSFESEDKARGMLKNVAGALKKGGRFLGVMPNSDVLRTKSGDSKEGGKVHPSEPTNGNAGGDDSWDPEKPADAAVTEKDTNGTAKKTAEVPALEWGNTIYKVKFPPTRALPADGVFRPPYGWKYFYFLEEAVDVPEYVVPWEGFRALAEEYGLELQFRKSFAEVWEDNKGDRELGPLADRMGVRGQDGRFSVTQEEMEAASFYHAFCFYKI